MTTNSPTDKSINTQYIPRRREMRAFDALPPAARDVLRYLPIEIGAESVADAIQRIGEARALREVVEFVCAVRPEWRGMP